MIHVEWVSTDKAEGSGRSSPSCTHALSAPWFRFQLLWSPSSLRWVPPVPPSASRRTSSCASISGLSATPSWLLSLRSGPHVGQSDAVHFINLFWNCVVISGPVPRHRNFRWDCRCLQKNGWVSGANCVNPIAQFRENWRLYYVEFSQPWTKSVSPIT